MPGPSSVGTDHHVRPTFTCNLLTTVSKLKNIYLITFSAFICGISEKHCRTCYDDDWILV